MDTRHDFRLNFMTNRGNTLTINVPHADSNATGSEVADAMSAIINSGIVYSVRGTPTAQYSAELIKTTRKEFNMTPALP